jgi:DNA-directed RNA polymerase subunit RPC12/RpoP
MRAHIDSQTGQVAGIDVEAKYTLAEIETLDISCPVCGSQVFVAPVDADSLAGEGSRRYMIGRARCARRCDFTSEA